MNPSERQPILVTGAHRSGTTWVGKMLALAPGIGYIHEPFNPMGVPGICNPEFKWFAYVTGENASEHFEHIGNILNFRFDVVKALKMLGMAEKVPQEYSQDEAKMLENYVQFIQHFSNRSRPLMKDPIALLASEWLASTFGMEVVVLIRHPAAFASSLKKLDWGFKFKGFLSRENLMRDYFGRFKEEIERCEENNYDVIGRAALAWKILYYVVSEYRRKYPDWIFIRHEDISRDPSGSFRDLYNRLGIEFTPGVEADIRNNSDSKNPQEWDNEGGYQNIKLNSSANLDNWKRRLTGDEIERIRRGVEGVSELFYTDSEW